MRLIALLAILLVSTGPRYEDTTPTDSASLYYVTQPQSTIYVQPDRERPYVHLRMREQVRVLEEKGGWARVRTVDGAEGYMMRGHLSNVWIRISKKSQTLYVYEGSELLQKLPVDLGYNYFADKEKRGSMTDRDHWRTPEGQFYVVSRNDRSQFYKALVLNYPNEETAEAGLRRGLISREEHAAILRAERESRMPPMNTALGGWIEIHGNGTGARSNWTQGCIALRDAEMDRLWTWVQLGAPVLIEP